MFTERDDECFASLYRRNSNIILLFQALLEPFGECYATMLRCYDIRKMQFIKATIFNYNDMNLIAVALLTDVLFICK